MPRGKKELAIPFAASVEVEVGRGKTVANGGQEDRCDGADVLVKSRSSTVASEKDRGQAAEGSREGEQPTEAIIGRRRTRPRFEGRRDPPPASATRGRAAPTVKDCSPSGGLGGALQSRHIPTCRERLTFAQSAVRLVTGPTLAEVPLTGLFFTADTQ